MGKKRLWAVVVMLLAVPGLAVAQTEWVDYEDNPVVEAPDPDIWNQRYVSEVIEVDGIYHMYFGSQPVGAPSNLHFEISHATSTDGLAWTMDPTNPVVSEGVDGEWDDSGIFGTAVIHDGSGFHMWFGGSDGQVTRVGYATSPDGSVWTKYDGNPVMDVGPHGSFDDDWVLPGTVIVQGGLYQMWYWSAHDTGPGGEVDWAVGYAESADGLAWTRHPTPVLEHGVGWESWQTYAPSVHFDGSTYHMWYTGTDGAANFGIGYAVSDDGIEWAKHLDNPVLGYDEQNTLHPVVLYDIDDGLYQMWYTGFDEGSEFEFNNATSGCCAALAYLSVMPAAAYAAGAEGSFYLTDLDLSNAGDTAAEYRFTWLPRGETNANQVPSGSFTLGPGMSVRYENVLHGVFGLEPDAFGALAIGSNSGDLLAMGRIYNRPDDGASGTFGQAMPAVPSGDFIEFGERRRIVFGTEHAEMRTNIGCQNMRNSSTLVNLELFAADGTSLEVKTMLLRNLSNDQFFRVFSDYYPMTGAVDVWTEAPNGSFYCYGSVLDNTTSDPTTILPQ